MPMDNLTHSLIGAVLGQAGLKRKTGLGMPTLIIAANIPDIDATCTVFGTLSLAMRRGITHGPIALLLLPLALTGIMLWFDRWQARRGKRPEDRLPVRPGWLLALAYIGCLSHPLVDWMNSYGIRLLEPFSHQWFYGDALFIVDPWLLAMLIAGVWFSRKRDQARRSDWRRPAWTAIGGVVAYLGLNLAISHAAISRGLEVFEVERGRKPEILVANPVPIQFWKRDVLWQGLDRQFASNGNFEFDALSSATYRPYRVRWSGQHPDRLTAKGQMNLLLDPVIGAKLREMAKGNTRAQAFLFWSRMPIVDADKPTMLGDQRMQGRQAGLFGVELKP
jgi:inner membrane protein